MSTLPSRDTEENEIADSYDSDNVNLESSLPYEDIATENTQEDYSSNDVYVNENIDTSKYIPNAQKNNISSNSRIQPLYDLDERLMIVQIHVSTIMTMLATKLNVLPT
ncbi:hypothetical protein GJ496_008640 [Pomphorhynchus laevis]|nr:hypothetical protein GJ496_008640 [Pomphorhynchus laevis]